MRLFQPPLFLLRGATVLIALLVSGCDVRREAADLEGRLSSLRSDRAAMLEDRDVLAKAGVYAGNSCRLIDRGPEPTFACGTPANKGLMVAAVCGTRGVELCRNMARRELGAFWSTIGDIFREATGFSACGIAINQAISSLSDHSYNFDKLSTFAGEAAADSYAVEALRRCEGPLCEAVTDFSMDGEEFKQRVIRSVGSCARVIMESCERRYQDWLAAPKRLLDRCENNERKLDDNAGAVSSAERQLQDVQDSISYKIATALNL